MKKQTFMHSMRQMLMNRLGLAVRGRAVSLVQMISILGHLNVVYALMVLSALIQSIGWNL